MEAESARNIRQMQGALTVLMNAACEVAKEGDSGNADLVAIMRLVSVGKVLLRAAIAVDGGEDWADLEDILNQIPDVDDFDLSQP